MFRNRLPSQSHAKGAEKARKRQKGFTLIEMLAVVIILVIVASIGFVVVNNQIEQSRQRTDAANVRTVADAVQRYIMDNSTAPTKVSDLLGGYLAQLPKDPWGDHDDEGDDANYITIGGGDEAGDVKITSAHNQEVVLKGAVPASSEGSGGGN